VEIIGLSGYARSGKDEAAKVLVEEFGFTRMAFADKLKEFSYNQNALIAVWRDWDGEPGEVYVQDVIDRYGWDGYKETMYKDPIRRLLQRTGTEGGRQTLWDNIWVDATLSDLHSDSKIVLSDCRFENEAQGIVDLGGQVWRVNRKGVGPANDHISETGIDNWPFDIVIDNDGDLKQYHRKIKDALTYSRLKNE
jgi:hypothetical protein